MNRREFLTGAGKSAIVIITAPALMQACGNITRDDISNEQESLLRTKIGSDKYEILRFASYAPSGHNAQPWNVKIISEDNWIIGITKADLLPAVDPDNHDTLISLGAFLSNLEAAAKYYGYDIEKRFLTEDFYSSEFVSVKLTKSSKSNSGLHNIKLRRTVRTKFLADDISSQDFSALAVRERCINYISRTSSEGRYLEKETLKANEEQAYRKDAQVELSNWIRWSNSEAEKHMDGLTTASLGVNGIAGLYVRLFYDKKSVMSDDFKKKSVEKTKEQLSSYGGWIVLTSQGDTVHDHMYTGEILEKFWREVREYNIALHPMTQILQEGNRREELNCMFGDGRKVQLILRAGYLNSYPDPVSLRRPVERFCSKV